MAGFNRDYLFFVFDRQQSIKHKGKSERALLLLRTTINETYPLHRVHTFQLDQNFRLCAHLLNNCNLHAKLQQGDMVAQDARYHDNYLIELYHTENTK